MYSLLHIIQIDQGTEMGTESQRKIFIGYLRWGIDDKKVRSFDFLMKKEWGLLKFWKKNLLSGTKYWHFHRYWSILKRGEEGQKLKIWDFLNWGGPFKLNRPPITRIFWYSNTRCPRKNVPLGQVLPSAKGTFFLGHPVVKFWQKVIELMWLGKIWPNICIPLPSLPEKLHTSLLHFLGYRSLSNMSQYPTLTRQHRGRYSAKN